ncbi:uncharacterized protein LOC134230941 [Saccostrea cucullata]|uniref:uncharacterized protein LOC134230941 n=1 Tax=Saccostrea cuccullata TaxID=36930 RepID=UPI002ED2C715
MTEKLLDQPMRYPQYAWLSKREATFEQGWPEPLLGKIPDLARAGLYYRGVKDKATCFHCGMTFSNWDPEDDPCVEHAYWNPSCPYINLYKGRGWVMNVFIAGLDQQGYKPLPEIKPLLNPEPDVQARGKWDNILLLAGPRHPKYREFKWKIKYVLAHQREGPEKTLFQGKWIQKSGDCIKDYGGWMKTKIGAIMDFYENHPGYSLDNVWLEKRVKIPSLRGPRVRVKINQHYQQYKWVTCTQYSMKDGTPVNMIKDSVENKGLLLTRVIEDRSSDEEEEIEV